MTTHSSTLAGESPWTEEPGGLQSMGPQRVGHDRATKHSTGEMCYYSSTLMNIPTCLPTTTSQLYPAVFDLVVKHQFSATM